jgi:putative Ca2+/H+ antiporter (TMEM165/GDT1 family)
VDWHLFWITFGPIFIAELGDKTQLGVLSLSAVSKSPTTIFMAASLALISATLAGVLAGSLLSKFINPRFLKIGGGICFVLVGLWLIIKRY